MGVPSPPLTENPLVIFDVFPKSLAEFQEFQALQTQGEQLHSADQAAIVTSKPTEVSGKVRTV